MGLGCIVLVCCFPQLQLLVKIFFWNNFCCSISIFSAQSVSDLISNWIYDLLDIWAASFNKFYGKISIDFRLKGHLPYKKNTFCDKVALDAFFFYLKKKFEFFHMKKKSFVLEISRFLCFCEIHKFRNLWRHQKHCCIMQVTLLFISFQS